MLKGKRAIITGASRGLGKATAILFAKNGAKAGINYLKSEEEAKKVFKEVKKFSEGILLKGDVSDFKEAKRLVEKFVKKFGGVDILVNNAGIYKIKKFDNLSEEEWDETIKFNLKSSFNMCKCCLPYMKKGKIIFISSQLALRGSSHGAHYAASKSALLGLMRSLAIEFAPDINVNAIAPGIIDTDIIASYSEEEKRHRVNEIPLKRIGLPEDVANVCLFLASNLSDYITGETINVNGGLYIA